MPDLPEHPLAACVDIGGSKALVGFVDSDGHILASERCPAPPGADPADVVAGLGRRLRSLAETSGIEWSRLVGLGYSSAGMMDVESGVIFASPNQGLWRDVPFKRLLQQEFHLPAWIEMDANAAALGEAWLGDGSGVAYFVYVVVGTGIGAGILVKGEVLRGWRGTAGEFGHMVIDLNGPLCACGNYGCLEILASGPAIALRAVEMLQHGQRSLISDLARDRPVSAEMVFQAARQGDDIARDLVRQEVDYLAVGLANLVHLFSPQVITLGGGVAVGGADLLLAPLRKAVLQRCGSWVDREGLRITSSRLGGNAGLLGAAHLVWKNLVEQQPKG